MIRPNSEKNVISTSDMVRPTRLQRRTRQFTPTVTRQYSVAELHPLASCYSNFTTLSWVGHVLCMFRIIFIYLNVTIINITYHSNCTLR